MAKVQNMTNVYTSCINTPLEINIYIHILKIKNKYCLFLIDLHRYIILVLYNIFFIGTYRIGKIIIHFNFMLLICTLTLIIYDNHLKTYSSILIYALTANGETFSV